MPPRGYGYGTRKGKTRLAHRFYYEEHVGPIPDGLHIDHLCRESSCVNPDHLEAVTCRENIRRGRSTKLSLDQIGEMVLRRLDGERAYDLAAEYGIGVDQIHALSRGAEAVLTLR